MNTNAINQRIENLKSEVAGLEAELEKAKEVDMGDWVPRHGEQYYYVDEFGGVLPGIRGSMTNPDHKNRIALGNYYHPSKRDELERAIELKKRFRKRVKELGGGRFVDGEANYSLQIYNCEFEIVFRTATEILPAWMILPNRGVAQTLMSEFTAEEYKLILDYMR